MKTSQVSLLAVVTLSTVSFMVGCGDKPPQQPATQPAGTSSTSESDHGHPHGGGGHGAGPHDGTLADWGGGKYHVEFTVDHDKQEATVYVLGSDEKTPEPINCEKVLLTITDPDFQTDLLPQPIAGDAEGTSSRFVGTHESLGIVQEYTGTLSAEVDGTPYAGNFKEEPHGDEH